MHEMMGKMLSKSMTAQDRTATAHNNFNKSANKIIIKCGQQQVAAYTDNNSLIVLYDISRDVHIFGWFDEKSGSAC